MFDFDTAGEAQLDYILSRHQQARPASVFFRVGKRIFDVTFSILLLPIVLVVLIVLILVNRVSNRGSVFFCQSRMGKDCVPFTAIKFRTMTASGQARAVNEPLETDRITPLGAFMRQTRIDELPQIFNVLRGEMSLIGPRPDYYDHACIYVSKIPGYRERHAVLPGISGLAQTEIGYVEGIAQTRRKVQVDLHYIANRSFRLEAWILWRTLLTVTARTGR